MRVDGTPWQAPHVRREGVRDSEDWLGSVCKSHESPSSANLCIYHLVHHELELPQYP